MTWDAGLPRVSLQLPINNLTKDIILASRLLGLLSTMQFISSNQLLRSCNWLRVPLLKVSWILFIRLINELIPYMGNYFADFRKNVHQFVWKILRSQIEFWCFGSNRSSIETAVFALTVKTVNNFTDNFQIKLEYGQWDLNWNDRVKLI